MSMNWLTFHDCGTVVKKGPMDKELDRHRLLQNWLGISISIRQSKGLFKRRFYLARNYRGVIFRLCFCHTICHA